jgi:RNA polymerase sigma factor (sigma-70 family)
MGLARHEEVLFRSGTMAGLSDGELLARFLDRGDAGSEAAFETIVARHGPMVLAACRRQLRDRGDADDAFQATFLTLARKAGSIQAGGSLGGWLHRVARHASGRARLGSARRGEVGSLPIEELDARADSPSSRAERDELRVVLDDELDLREIPVNRDRDHLRKRHGGRFPGDTLGRGSREWPPALLWERASHEIPGRRPRRGFGPRHPRASGRSPNAAQVEGVNRVRLTR